MASPTASLVPDPTSIPWNLHVSNQDFNVTGLDGNPQTISMADVTNSLVYNFRLCAVQGFIVGFSAMLMAILLLLTNKEKARRPIFILNFLALFFLCFRSIAQLAMFGTSVQGLGYNFIGAQAQYSLAFVSPVFMQALLSPLIYFCMLFSLVLQVRVVFAAEPRSQQIITVVGSLAALFLVGLGWYIAAIFMQGLLGTLRAVVGWPYDALRIGIMIFVAVSCLLFLYKLALAIRRRKRMGFKKFGPLQVLFIIFAQCLVIPLVVYILDFTVPSVKNLSGLAQCFLICSLPLSSVWASHEADAENKHGNAMTTDSDLTHSHSSRSSRLRGKFRAFMATRKDANSNNDLERAPSYSEKSARTDRTEMLSTSDSL